MFARVEEGQHQEVKEAANLLASGINLRTPTPCNPTISPVLYNQDQDQEVKEAAIMAVSHILAALGDQPAVEAQVRFLWFVWFKRCMHLCR